MTASIRLAIATVILLLLLAVLGPAACQRMRSQGVQHRVDQEQLDAQSNSAVDAIATVGNVAATARAAEDLTRTNEKEIRNAEGANVQVAPAVNDAGLRSLCRRAAYRDSERCRLLQSGAR